MPYGSHFPHRGRALVGIRQCTRAGLPERHSYNGTRGAQVHSDGRDERCAGQAAEYCREK
jgi:hypothetical protein